MQEPPRLPQPNGSNGIHFEANPFAPSSAGIATEHTSSKAKLGSTFWITFVTILLVCVVAALLGYPLALGGALSILVAAIRVPLLQRRHARLQGHGNLPNSTALLFSSWALMIVFVVVSSIAFAVVCVPTALISFSSNASGLTFPLTCGGMASLISFCTMFVVSLRLPF